MNYKDKDMNTLTKKYKFLIAKVLRSPLLWMGVLVVPLVMGLWMFRDQVNIVQEPHKEKEEYESCEDIQLGGEKPGVRIELVRLRTEMEPTPLAIRVHTSQGMFFLESRKQLEGLLDVTDTDTAMRLVRLPTKYLFAMPEPLEQEIRQKEIPSPGTIHSIEHLPAELFKKGGFTLATIQEKDGTYIITRWVFIDPIPSEKPKVYQVRETVGKNASYRREILKEKPAPELPGVQWGIPRRM